MYNIGDIVYTIERHGNTIWKWKSTIIKIESNYIEPEYYRDINNVQFLELCKNLAPGHRAFIKQTVKNYYAPDGTINIQALNNDS